MPDTTAAAAQQTRPRPRWRGRRVLALIALVLIGSTLLGQGWVRQEMLRRSVLAGDGPSDADMARLVGGASDPVEALTALWRTGKVAHRAFVASHLREHAAKDARLWPAARPLVLEAVRSRDGDVVESSLAVLRDTQDPEAEPAALRLLEEADPGLRRAGLQLLARPGNQRLVPALVAKLDDPDPFVRTVAAGALEDWTGQSVGIRSDSDAARVKARAEAMRQWLEARGKQYPAAPAVAPLPPVTGAAADFTLNDLAGRPVRLGDFRGRVVLLNFWATWCPPCVEEIPTLVQLARRRPDRLTILGVSADALGDKDEHDHDHAGEGESAAGDPVATVRRAAGEMGIGYPVLLDRDGAVFAAYRGDGLPTTVLIDQAGRVRRRFVGARSFEVLEKMINEVDLPAPTTRPSSGQNAHGASDPVG